MIRRATAALFVFLFLLGSLFSGAATAAEPLTVAVAANALKPLREIAGAYTDHSATEVRIVSGSTGKLFTQIVQGAPFDVFLAADALRPELLEERGLTLVGSRFTYARGELVIWTGVGGSSKLGLSKDGLSGLSADRVVNIAIANPKTAPYGAAAIEALAGAGVLEEIKGKLVYGESVAQALAFARSGNADAAIVALSTVYGAGGEQVEVESSLYEPILQQAVVIKGAHVLATDFAEFLRSEKARTIFKKYGYATGGHH